MTTALVTGATSGLGAAFARTLAAEGTDLVLVSRDADRLDSIAGELRDPSGVSVEVTAADLSTEDGIARVERRLATHPVDLLINNAGRGMSASFLEADPADLAAMTALHVTATMRLTRAAVEQMAARGRGDVINVSSIAGMIPGRTPIYGADKAWVTAFTEALAARFAPRVRLMALCPGFVTTEFHARMGVSRPGPGWLWLDPDAVVREALQALRRGAVVHVSDRRYRVMIVLFRFVPRPILRRLAASRR